MTRGSVFRSGLHANRAEAPAPVLFGTTGPSEVSAFATAKVVGGRRFSRSANLLRPGLQNG